MTAPPATDWFDDVSLNEGDPTGDIAGTPIAQLRDANRRLRLFNRSHRTGAEVQVAIAVSALNDDAGIIQGRRTEVVPTLDKAHPATGSQFLRRLLVGIDAVALLMSWVPFLLLYPSDVPSPRFSIAIASAVAIGVTTLVALAFAATEHLYQARVCAMKQRERALLVRVSLVSPIIGSFILFLFGDRPADASLVAVGATAFILLVIGRSGYRGWLGAQRIQGRYCRSTIIIGANDEALRWCRIFTEHPELGVIVQGVVSDEPPETNIPAARWLGGVADLTDIVRAEGATGALVIVTAFSPAALNRITRQVLNSGLHVELSTGLLGFAADRLRLKSLSHENLFYLERRPLTPVAMATKRTFDVIVASLLLVASLPVLLVAGILIRLADGGPALFRQQRVGRGGKTFTFYKLRTMTVDAEARKQEIAALNLRQAPLFKVDNDPRVTRVGRSLRKWSIDELPQLLNVLQGHMSLVGPRPALPEEVEQFDAELLARNLVLPGITGLWQLEARDDVSFDSYQRLDLHYVENWSIFLDMSILVSTATSVVVRTLRRDRLSNS